MRDFAGLAVLLMALAARAEGPTRFEKNGVAIEFSFQRAGAKGPGAPLLEGELAEARFKVTDATSGEPMRGLDPAAWMDVAGSFPGKGGEPPDCREKVGLFLKGIVGMRPMVDLNGYFLLVLNRDASISVIDPVVGISGKTNLFATALLKAPGSDWVASKDGKRVFVAMPRAGQVAVMETDAFKVVANVDVGGEPVRTVLQPDGRYVWVTTDAPGRAPSGVAVIDADTLKAVGRVTTGRGHHEVAFPEGSRRAFVTNRDDGTVSVVDVAKLEKIKDLAVGPVPISVAWSPVAQAISVAEGAKGVVALVDPDRLEIRERIALSPGLGPQRVSPDGRWTFVLNPAAKAVHVVDATRSRLAHTIALPGQPFEIAFTRGFAYLRLLDSEKVAMVNLALLAGDKPPPVQSFGAGTAAPNLAGELALAPTLSPATTEAAMFAANPADNTVYYYMEGMNAAAGSFLNFGHVTSAVSIADRSLREVEPGVYAARLRVPAAAKFEVAFLLESPRLVHCFTTETHRNPAVPHTDAKLAVAWLTDTAAAKPGDAVKVRFRLTDPETGKLRAGLADVHVLSFTQPGHGRTEVAAREVSEGVYEAAVTVREAGAWFAHVGARSLDVKFGTLPYHAIAVVRRPGSGK